MSLKINKQSSISFFNKINDQKWSLIKYYSLLTFLLVQLGRAVEYTDFVSVEG